MALVPCIAESAETFVLRHSWCGNTNFNNVENMTLRLEIKDNFCSQLQWSNAFSHKPEANM